MPLAIDLPEAVKLYKTRPISFDQKISVIDIVPTFIMLRETFGSKYPVIGLFGHNAGAVYIFFGYRCELCNMIKLVPDTVGLEALNKYNLHEALKHKCNEG